MSLATGPRFQRSCIAAEFVHTEYPLVVPFLDHSNFCPDSLSSPPYTCIIHVIQGQTPQTTPRGVAEKKVVWICSNYSGPSVAPIGEQVRPQHRNQSF